MIMNLHNIFSYLISDENFLSTIIETDNNEFERNKKNKKKGFNLMNNVIIEYSQLSPYETQNYSQFSAKMKQLLTPDYYRLGIKNIMEKNLNVINISFLNSLNMLIRPDLYTTNIDSHIKNFSLLEEFIVHKIHRNFQIDKVKNTKKVQAANKVLIKNLLEGKISHELIQTVINIFEINLLVFDLTKNDSYFYWTCGHKYPYLNTFKNIYCMAYIQGNYEPIMPMNNIISVEQEQKMYTHILTNLSDFKCTPEIHVSLHSLLYIETWDIDIVTLAKIINLYLADKKTAKLIKIK